jgi:prepilin-type N-terminal cleavage/methylation domain-containing protein
MRRTARSQPRGFTLFELVLVMLVLAVVMAMVAPKLAGTARGRRTGDAATQIAALAYYARSQAVTEGRTYRLNIQPGDGSYWITMQDGPSFVDPANGWGNLNHLPEGVRIAACDFPQHQDGIYAEFRPSGRVDPGYIRIVDDDNQVAEIACESATELYRILGRNEPSSRRQ